MTRIPPPAAVLRQAVRVAPGSLNDFESWRWAVSPVYDMDAATADARRSYGAESEAFLYADMPISATSFSASRFDRTPGVIAKAGLDGIMVQVYQQGEYRFEAEGRDGIARPGDIVALDLTRRSCITAARATTTVVIVPRHLLTPLTSGLDDAHGLLLPRGSTLNALLVSHLRLLVTEVPRLDHVDGAAVAKATAGLVATCIGMSTGTRDQAHARAVATVARLVRQEIDDKLADPALGPEWLAQRFRLSRARLYRMFDSAGGVRHYIQHKRLARVHQALADPALSRERVMTIAARFGFRDKTVFSRAFRAMYGLAPSEFRNLAQSRRPGMGEPPSPITGSFADIHYWTQLGTFSQAA